MAAIVEKNNTIVLPLITSFLVFVMHLFSLDFISSLIFSYIQQFLIHYGAIILSIYYHYKIYFFIFFANIFLIKLKEMNRLLKEEKRMNTNTIRYILRSFDALYREINEYNSTFLSKYLLIIWLFFGTIITFLIFIIIFNPLAIIIRISLSYFLCLYIIMYIFILSIASSVNLEAKISCKLFNSFYIRFRKTSKLDKRLLTINQIKVNFHHKNEFLKLIFISDQHNY